jgi:microcin C transport system substrate-binding protein
VRDAAVDALVEAAIGARSQAEHVAALQSLDRVLSWSFYAIPGYAADFNRLVYWDRFGFPDTAAAYFTDYPTSWWFDAARDARVRAVRAGR